MKHAVIHIRLATLDDAGFLLRLRNDPETRLNSHNTDPVEEAGHVVWLERNLKDPQVKIYIAALEGRPVGTVRVTAESTWKHFSWTVAPECRGQGYGHEMVNTVAGCTDGLLRAEVKVGNVSSQKIATKAGFILEHEKDGVRYYVLTTRSKA